MLDKILSQEEAERIFKSNAFLLVNCDVFPLKKARELFGTETIVQATTNEACNQYGTTWNCYSHQGHSVDYLTWAGFRIAATIHNIKLLDKTEAGA